MSVETNISSLSTRIGQEFKQVRTEIASNSGGTTLSNTEEFQDETYIYFLFDVSTGGYQVNRYENSTVKTIATGATRPTTLVELQSLTYN